ncbi:amidohydrolase [Acidaminobacter sp. JC074]|uniref:amidohydrolase family protein n=1 Tax=Acidaminobacter sp. JC074 TaxID=2530199 RepID=UPI001F105F86|nr:amidohydrolase family protein [Acidaminobacter sp. JC074]MCH4888375.1 amidohydrolase [Acidaminobacter sp. JC074]
MIAYKAKRIYTIGNEYIDQAYLLIKDGKIVEISTEVDKNIEVVDLSHKMIMPGLIDPHTHLGVWGDGEGQAGYDGNEWSAVVSGHVHIMDSINPKQMSFQTAIEGGVTCAQVLPGSSNAIGGLCCVVKTSGDSLEEMLINPCSGLKGATGENVKRTHGQNQNHGTITRMGVASKIRNYFNEVLDYKEKKNQAGEDFKVNLNYESGLKVINKEIPFRVHAHRHDDIVSVTRLCEEFGIDYSIEHCTDGHLIADYLGPRKSTVMLGPGLSSSGKVEADNYSDKNASILHEAGARVSLMSDHPFLNIRYFLHYAAVVHKHGLDMDTTLRAITINPAKALNVDHRVGSLEAGKDADFIVLGGLPLTLEGRIEKTYINGTLKWER